MPRTATRAGLRGWSVVCGVLSLAFATGCLGLVEAANPLSPKAKRVAFVPSEQQATVALTESCRRVGRLEQVRSEHFARERAAGRDANVVQILSALRSNGRVVRLDVRFWSCDEPIQQRLARK